MNTFADGYDEKDQIRSEIDQINQDINFEKYYQY